MFTELQDRWGASFSDCPPFRPTLRRVYSERWLRVHSLAEMKRLPTGPRDDRELLRRHEVVAGRLLSIGGDCAIVVAYANGYRGNDEPPSVTAFRLQIANGWSERWSSDPEVAADLEDMVFAVGRFAYDPKVLAPLVLDVAYGRTAPLLVFSMSSGRVYSPYDGGADLFFESVATCDAARTEWADWGSRRPDGS